MSVIFVTFQAITTWAKAESIPLVNEFNQENAGRIFGSDIKVHLLLLADKNSKV